MKIPVVLLSLLFCTELACADDPVYIPIQVVIETKSGEKISSWLDYEIRISMDEIDSVKDERYLKRYFMSKGNTDSTSTDSLPYYKYRIHYSLDTFNDHGQQIQYESYMKLDWRNLSYRDIRNISVLQVEDVRKKWDDTSRIVYTMYIENQISASDTIWMKKKPVQKFTFNGYQCSFYLIIHERNSKTDDVVKKLKALELLPGKDLDKDNKMLKLIQAIKGLKVIGLVPPCFC